MNVETKRWPIVEVKAEGSEPGTFTALVSRFGNVDEAGDRVMPGSFTPALERHGLPAVYWNHAWVFPGPIGESLDAAEEERGLRVKARLWIDEDPFVRRIHRGMLAGQVREFSFAYTVADSREVEEDGKTVREILAFDRVYEWGPVTAGMNPETELLEVAGLLVPIGRKAAAPSHSTPVVDDAWDGGRAVREAEMPDDLAIFAWVDEERRDAKSAHKLPHHWPAAVDGRRPAVIAGFRAAMGALLGARGGVDIPAGDRRGVWEHLARHYRDADLEPPELRAWTPEALRSSGYGLEAEALGAKHQRGPSLIQQAHDLLVRAGAKCETGSEEPVEEAARDGLPIIGERWARLQALALEALRGG